MRLLPAIAAVGLVVAAGGGTVAQARTSDDHAAVAAVAVVDLRSAIVQEEYARHAFEVGSVADIDQAIENSRKALTAVITNVRPVVGNDEPWLGQDPLSRIVTLAGDARGGDNHIVNNMVSSTHSPDWEHWRDHAIRYLDGALKDKEAARL